MTRNGHSDFSFRVRILFTVSQVALVLLRSGNQAAAITVSPSSLVVPSLTIQNNLTTNSLSTNGTKTTFVRTKSIASSLFLLTSSSKNAQSAVNSRYTKTWTRSSWITMSQTASTSVTQFHYTTTPALPTTVLVIKGLPSVEVVAAIAGVLGAILLILLAIIVWNLCIAEGLHTRRSSRVVPSDTITETGSGVV